MDTFSMIRHYIEKLFKHPEIKGAFAMLCTLLAEFFGAFNEPVQLLVILVVVDLFTGIAKGIKYKNIHSKIIRKSIWKTIEYLAFIFLGNMGERSGITGFRNLVIFWINFTELVSITENLDELGFDVPNFISKYLKNKKEEISNEKGG